jgi:hypothetical protein
MMHGPLNTVRTFENSTSHPQITPITQISSEKGATQKRSNKESM